MQSVYVLRDDVMHLALFLEPCQHLQATARLRVTLGHRTRLMRSVWSHTTHEVIPYSAAGPIALSHGRLSHEISVPWFIKEQKE